MSDSFDPEEEEIEVRDRLSQRNGRRRLELEARRGAKPMVTVVLGVAVGLLVAGYIATHISKTLFSSTEQLAFVVDDATGVVKGVDEVRLKGIGIGRVTSIEIKDEHAVITAKVQKKYGEIYRNARAQLRPNTALQDMYLDIVDRGTTSAGVLRGSDPLAAGRTQVPVSIDEVLNVFQAPVRVRLATLLDQLGNGLVDHGARLRTAFAQFVPFIDRVGQVSRQLAVRAPMVRRLVGNTSVLSQTLGQRQEQLNTLVDSGSRTLTTLKDSSGDLGATLEALPPTLASVDSSFTAVRGVVGDVDGAMRALGPVADALPASLASLRGLNTSAAPAVRALQTPVQKLVPFTRTLKPLSSELAQAVDALQPQVHTVNKVTEDLVACKKGVIGFFQWNASISKLGDSRAPFPRGNLVAGAQSSSVLNDPDEFFPSSCAPGRPIGGRPAKPSDGR
ncbi:MAG: MCE-family protein Mce6D [Solirubrobacterales bacterium]|nr:MCE-family protein Mce6D [Solirubrobacterales bacterium]